MNNHTRKIAWIAGLSVLVLVVSTLLPGSIRLANTSVTAAEPAGFDWQITANDFVRPCESLGQLFLTRPTMRFSGTVQNGSASTLEIRSAAFHSNTAGCTQTTDHAAPGLSFAGQALYLPGDNGSFTFSYSPNAVMCGRVQLDAAFHDRATGARVSDIFGIVLNYGVDCDAPAPTPTPVQTATPTPAQTAAPTQTPPVATPPILPGSLIARCEGTVASPRIVLDWTTVSNANSNGLQKGDSFPGDSNQFWAFVQPQPAPTDRHYVDTAVAPNTTYNYRVKYAPSVASNIVVITTDAATCGGAAGTPAPTPTPVQILPGTLTARCEGTVASPRIVLDWTSGVNANSNGLQKGDSFPSDPNQFWNFVQPQPAFSDRHYVDANVAPNTAYSYRVKYSPDVPSNIVTLTTDAATCGGAVVTPAPTPTPTPSATPTPTPTPVALACTPSFQTVVGGQPVTFTATGGIGGYTWTAPGGNPGNGTGTPFVTTYPVQSFDQMFTALVRSGNEFAVCTVRTLASQPQNAAISVSKTVRDITTGGSEAEVVTANPNDTVEFVIRVASVGPVTATNVRVTDTLPFGLRYVNGSTTVDGFTQSDTITTSGISLGDMTSGRNVTIRFRATVDGSTSFVVGTTTLVNIAFVSAANATPVSDTATLSVTNGGAVPNPTNLQLSIQKFGRNITLGQAQELSSVTVRANDTIEFIIHVRNVANATINNVTITDTLPAGLTYLTNSTSVDNRIVGDNIAGAGYNIGSLLPNQEAIIRFSARMHNASRFPNGSLTAFNTASVRGDNTPTASAQLPLSYGTITQVVQVKTGAAGTLATALVLSSILTFGYARYTRTGLFLRRDANALVRRAAKDPQRLNFARFL